MDVFSEVRERVMIDGVCYYYGWSNNEVFKVSESTNVASARGGVDV